MKQSEFHQKYGPWALITGASSGIGAEFARQLAALGMNLLLVARRETRMQTLAAQLQSIHGIQTRVLGLDLSQEDFLPAVQAASSDIEIGLLVNNAGFSKTGKLLDQSLASDLEMLYVNGRTPLILTHTFGQQMRQRQRGGIIFVSSIASFTPIPLWTHYAATKAYGRYLAEGLADELQADNIDVLALCPGTTARTEFADVAGIDEFMALDAETVVADGLKQLGRKKRSIPGNFYKVGIFASRFMPSHVNRFVFGRIIGSLQK